MLEGDDDVWDEVKVCTILFLSYHHASSSFLTELHENPHADVLRTRALEGRAFLRNCHPRVHEGSAAYVHRMCTSRMGGLGGIGRLFQGTYNLHLS